MNAPPLSCFCPAFSKVLVITPLLCLKAFFFEYMLFPAAFQMRAKAFFHVEAVFFVAQLFVVLLAPTPLMTIIFLFPSDAAMPSAFFMSMLPNPCAAALPCRLLSYATICE